MNEPRPGSDKGHQLVCPYLEDHAREFRYVVKTALRRRIENAQ